MPRYYLQGESLTLDPPTMLKWGLNGTNMNQQESYTATAAPDPHRQVRDITLATVGLLACFIFLCFVVSMVSSNEKLLKFLGVADKPSQSHFQLEVTKDLNEGGGGEGYSSLGFNFSLPSAAVPHTTGIGLDGVLSTGMPVTQPYRGQTPLHSSPSPVSFSEPDVESLASGVSSAARSDVIHLDSLKVPQTYHHGNKRAPTASDHVRYHL